MEKVKEKPVNTKAHMLVEIDDYKAIVPYLEYQGKSLRFVTPDGIQLESVNKKLQNMIAGPPVSPTQLHSKACQNDMVTIDSWSKQWLEFCAQNAKTHNFNEDSAFNEYKKEFMKPIVLLGSGPSLKKNAYELKNKGDIKVISCLHNFGYLEDLGVMTKDDYYLTLDSGKITIPELYEGGKKEEEHYWGRTKDRTLIAYVSTHPDLIKKWQGRILWFATPTIKEIADKIKVNIDPTKVPYFSTGGNALGACLYFARAILGCGAVIFAGADFAFDRTNKFHSWDSPYDEKFSGVIPQTNIFGDRVYTWPSYHGFSCWFQFIACGGQGNQPHQFINSTEGGILGAWPDGNIAQITQMDLISALHMFNISNDMVEMMKNAKENPVVLF